MIWTDIKQTIVYAYKLQVGHGIDSDIKWYSRIWYVIILYTLPSDVLYYTIYDRIRYYTRLHGTIRYYTIR